MKVGLFIKESCGICGKSLSLRKFKIEKSCHRLFTNTGHTIRCPVCFFLLKKAKLEKMVVFYMKI